MTTHPTPTSTRGSVVGFAVALVLWAALCLASLLVGFFSLFSGMLSDGCYDGVETGICGDTGSAIWGVTIVVFWLVLLAMAVLALVMPIIWLGSGRNGWWWPLVAAAVDLLAIGAFLGVMGALSP